MCVCVCVCVRARARTCIGNGERRGQVYAVGGRGLGGWQRRGLGDDFTGRAAGVTLGGRRGLMQRPPVCHARGISFCSGGQCPSRRQTLSKRRSGEASCSKASPAPRSRCKNSVPRKRGSITGVRHTDGRDPPATALSYPFHINHTFPRQPLPPITQTTQATQHNRTRASMATGEVPT